MIYSALSDDEVCKIGVLSAVSSLDTPHCGFCFPEIKTASRWAINELIRLKRIEALYLDIVGKAYITDCDS